MIVIADEIIVFTTLDTIAVVWMFGKMLVNQWTNSTLPPAPSPPRPHPASRCADTTIPPTKIVTKSRAA